MKKIKKTYTVISHPKLKKMGITANDYIILDIIYHLSNDNDWCYASKEYMGKCIGISKSAVENIIHKLVEQKFISTKDKTIKYLKITDKFLIDKECEDEDEDEVVESGKKVAHSTTEVAHSTTQVVETTTNSNIYINNNINNIIKEFSFLGEDYKRFYKIPAFRSSITRLLEFSNAEEIIKRLRYAFQHRSDKFFPQINTPQDLENKWDKLKVDEQSSEGVNVDELFNKYNK